MTSFRIKQISLVICLMASMLTASPAACVCSHHDEAKAAESDCHSQHESAEVVKAGETGDAIEESCICFVYQRSPFVTSKAESKNVRSDDTVSSSEQDVIDLEFVAATAFHLTSPTFTNELSYSHTLRSLLPSRAPPRL